MYALQEPTPNLHQDEPTLLSNRAALERLERDRERLTAECYLAAGALIAGITFTNPVVLLASAPALGVLGIQLKKVSQIHRNLGRLLKEFESQEVILTPQLEVPENGTLDLFVRFPNPPKANFAIGFRSNGNAKVYYDLEKESLVFRRKKGGGRRPWEIDLFRRIGLQEFWLRKNRQALFGQSSRDKNRAVIKLLVITGETKLGQHPEQMYVTIGDQSVLLVQKRVAVYILEERQLIPFIKAWLAKSENTQ